jgi:LCP family protein required for cell wall assembly
VTDDLLVPPRDRGRPLPEEDQTPADARPRRRRLPALLGLTLLGAVLPGSALLAAGRRRWGTVVLLLSLLAAGGVVWLATAGRRTAVRWAVDSASLSWVIGALVGVVLVWLVVQVAGWRALSKGASTLARVVTGLLVLVLAAGLVLPSYLVTRNVVAQRDLLNALFPGDRRSATVSEPTDAANPFGPDGRVNVLLLGGDGGAGREGVRTDTVILASLDTNTGQTTLFSLPRNLENLPFPPGSALAARFPNGFQAGRESEGLLNAVYRNGPTLAPGILGPTDDEGADMLKLGVGTALGLPVDYYVLVNLDGFSQLVDALGGVTVNVNYYVPINGITGQELPDGYIAPGAAQHLDGYLALQFARGRYGLTDYDRMDRQRCTIQAIVDSADPVTLLEKYQQLAATTQGIVKTDIPRSVLDDFADLAFKVKGADLHSVVFDDSVINPAYPDYPAMRTLVQQALTPSSAAPSSAAPSSAAPSSAAPSSAAPSSAAPSGSAAPGATSSAAPAPTVRDTRDACAYDPARAQAALAAGQPPTRKG